MPFHTIFAPYAGFPLKIDAEDFSEAAKKAIKLNQEVQIMSMIINDHTNNMRMLANVDYYNQDGRRKAGVKMAKTKALGYQGYPHISPIVVGMSSDSDVTPYLLPFGPMAVNGLGGPAIIAGPAGTGLAAFPSGRAGPYSLGGPFGIPSGAVPFLSPVFVGSDSKSVEGLQRKVDKLNSDIKGAIDAAATTGLASAEVEKYKRLEADLRAKLPAAESDLASAKAKKAAGGK